MSKKSVVVATLVSVSLSVIDVASAARLSDCRYGCFNGETCVGNPFMQPVTDADCTDCASGQWHWPCDFETLCYCHHPSEKRIPPAPASGLSHSPLHPHPCDWFTEAMFEEFAPGAEPPYTHAGLCDAIDAYNQYHDEKAFRMGTPSQQKAELAAFLGHTYTETNGYTRTRDTLHCADAVNLNGQWYCKPCHEQDFDTETQQCRQSLVANNQLYTDYCNTLWTPPQGCSCGPVSESPEARSLSMPSYIDAHDAYFERGALPISWNRDYIGMSVAYTGSPQLFCDEPDLVATEDKWAWAAGIYAWMEKLEFGTTGTTAHMEATQKGSFGGTIKNMHGPLECPANPNLSEKHDRLVKERINHYCRAVSVIPEASFLKFGGCDGLQEEFRRCVDVGDCPDCASSAAAMAILTATPAPTTTPAVVTPPTGEDWFNNRPNASRRVTCSSHVAVSALFGVLLLVLL